MANFEKRSGNWRAIVRKKGFPRLAKTFDTKAEAETWAATVESEMGRGVFVSMKEAENTTLAEALDRYEREVIPSKKGAKAEIVRMRIWNALPWQTAPSPPSREKISRPIVTPGSKKWLRTPSVTSWQFSPTSSRSRSRSGEWEDSPIPSGKFEPRRCQPVGIDGFFRGNWIEFFP